MAIDRGTARAARRTCGLQGRGRRHSQVALAVAVALYGAASLRVTARAADDDTSMGTTLQEVVITARKRTENLQDVPESIDVFTSKDLENLSISQFEDYATKTPSVTFVSIGPGQTQFFMRGVSDGSSPNAQNLSTTGFFVDDMSMSYYGVMPDLHSYDIERIEVLNGPQGTLFGAGSMSGAVRIISKKPDLDAFSAGIDLDGGKIQHGTDNTTYEGFVNLPLIDGRTALRLSAYSVHDGGFIDNLLTTRQWVNGVVSNNAAWARSNYNTQSVAGGRAAIRQVIAEGLGSQPDLLLPAPAAQWRLGPGSALRRRQGLALRARERQQLPALVRSAPRRRCRHRRSGLCRDLLVAEPAHHR